MDAPFILKLFMWLAGASFTGFVVLLNWYKGLEKKQFDTDTKIVVLEDMKKKIDEVHLYLIGNMDKEGLISRVSRIDRECKLRHKES